MTSFFKRLCAFAAALCLLTGSACAQGLSAAISPYIDLNRDVHYAMSAQIKTLTPYGDQTVDMLNGVLKHLSISAQTEEDATALEICVSGEPVLEMTQQQTENGTQLTSSLLPNRTLTSAGSAMDVFSGQAQQQEKFDVLAAISQLEGCYRELTDAILPFAEQKTANYKITGVATSKWSRIARLTEEQGEQIAPLIEKVLSCGMDDAYRETIKGLSVSKGFIVGLYQTAEGGDDLAVYMKGYVTFADGIARNLAFQWAFTEKEGTRIDTFKYELLKSKKAVDTRKIGASLKRRTDDRLLVSGESSAAIKDADGNITTTWTYDLNGQASGDVRTVNGSVSKAVRTVEGEKASTTTITFTPEMKLTSSEGSGVLSGTVGIEQKTGKVIHTDMQLLFDEEPARLFVQAAQSGVLFAVSDDASATSSLMQNIEMPEKPQDYLVGAPPIGLAGYTAPDTMQTVDLDTADADTLGALMGEITQNLAGRLLIALTKIPEEDAALIRDNLSSEDYAAFLEMVDAL